MGTFITDLGSINIPENKREEYIRDAKIIAEQGGLFERSFVQIFGHNISLLTFPNFNNDYADFTYSYYEQRPWENAGINIEKFCPYSNKIGWKQFNKAVQALYLLTEIYSDTLYVSSNDSLNVPVSTLLWIRYVLNRPDLHLTWREHMWEIYERMSLASSYYAEQCSAEKFFDDFCGDIVDINQLIDIQIVKDGSKQLIDMADETNSSTEKPTLSMPYVMKKYYQQTLENKETSEIDEERQLKQLLQIFCLDISLLTFSINEFSELSSLTIPRLLSPKVRLKIISEIYDKDFWELWKQVKDKISPDCKPALVYKRQVLHENETLTTEEFFRINSDDRLYWWKADGDVKISDETQKWFDSISVRFSEILASFEPSQTVSIIDWQKRLAVLAEQQHHGVYFFEEMFYEFFGNFYEPEFRAWLILLEEYSQDEQHYKLLHAVIANKELRKKVFDI